MEKIITLNVEALPVIRTVDSRLMSYNIEMTEVTGGTFWKSYTKEQIAGTESFPQITDFQSMTTSGGLMQVYPPIDSKNELLINLAKEFGPVWIRVSGTWSTKTYYDFDGSCGGVIPNGYQSILTKSQWLNLLDFVKAVNGKLLISVANCQGLHSANEPWNPSEAEKIFSLSKEYGVEIEAAEFMNEPNMLALSGAPYGYTAADFVRDQDLFFSWLKKHYPNCLRVGPCTIAMETAGDMGINAGGIVSMMGGSLSTDDLMKGSKEQLDVYSYHYYNGISERLASMMPQMHWDPNLTLSEHYLSIAPMSAKLNSISRDKYCPGGQMWVTESGDAGGGGNTWASTYTDVFRTLNELGTFAQITDGIIFHNTLASSDYGFLDHHTFKPRPNYFAVLLWNRLMGTTVFNPNIESSLGCHVFAHSRRDGKDGIAYLIINNSKTDSTYVNIPKDGVLYLLSADNLRNQVMKLNGRDLVLNDDNSLPNLGGDEIKQGKLELKPETIAFIIL